MKIYPYIVIDAPGYYGDWGGTVYSGHNSYAAARRAARRANYTDERGVRRMPRVVARNDRFVKGDSYYRDTAPVPVVASP